jgi:hypothetical protein
MTVFSISIFNINTSFSYYKADNWGQKIIERYDISQGNLWEEITRKEFVEILYSFYVDYKKERWVSVNYENYQKLDNSKIFTDIDLNSDFWKKLNYFSDIWAFSKNIKFNPNNIISQKAFFTIMKRLKIIYSLNWCKSLRICEKELTQNSPFLKWTYIKYISKIMYKDLRKYYSKPQDYIKAWYKPYLSPNYYFPLRWQTLNWCYAFSIRNITKYDYWIWMYISKMEKYMQKPWTQLWNYNLMNKFDKLAHIKRTNLYHLDSLINNLQSWKPVAITYYLDYYNYKERKYKKVLHIVSAYSFDEKWVWISETVTNKRLRIWWNEVFNTYWTTSNKRMFLYNYIEKKHWTPEEIELENKYNFLVGEY